MTTNADLSLVVNSTLPSSLPQSAEEMAPPIKPKAQTITTSSQDARLLVRETIRISATLASEPPSASAHSSSSISAIPVPVECRSIDYGRLNEQFVDSSFRLICCEEYDGRRWKYVVDENGGSGKIKKSSIRAVSLQTPPTPVDVWIRFSFT